MELFIKLRKEKFLGRGMLKMRDAHDKSSAWVWRKRKRERERERGGGGGVRGGVYVCTGKKVSGRRIEVFQHMYLILKTFAQLCNSILINELQHQNFISVYVPSTYFSPNGHDISTQSVDMWELQDAPESWGCRSLCRQSWPQSMLASCLLQLLWLWWATRGSNLLLPWGR